MTSKSIVAWDPDRIAHLNRNIAPEAHTAMYVWHKFWSRKTWNVVGEFIKNYSPPEGLVFDPFAGSGVTALEALRHGRRAIACDLSPIATEIIRLTIKPIAESRILEAFRRIESSVKAKILSLYTTECRKCGKAFPATCFIWKKDECIEVRYESCPNCRDRKEKNCKPTKFDLDLLDEIEKKQIKEWYPKNEMYYPDGQPFKKKERYETLDQLFTRRNLQALAWIMEAVESESLNDHEIGDFLKIAFTSCVHLCSKMCPISEAGHFTPFSSAWTQHSYWYPSGRHMEQNVWLKFESAILGHQGLIKAKTESNPFFKNVKVGHHFQDVIEGKADVYVHKGSCLDLMSEMPANSVDYIFTDPPYDASIQYGELTYLWVAWLKKDKGFLDNVVANEIIRNERQGKDFEYTLPHCQDKKQAFLRWTNSACPLSFLPSPKYTS